MEARRRFGGRNYFRLGRLTGAAIMDSEKMGNALVEAVRGYVKRSLDPIRENIGGLVQRADKHYRQIAALEARVAALEGRSKGKSAVVYLDTDDSGRS